jgi:Carboxypeptidase regulatory-like domain
MRLRKLTVATVLLLFGIGGHRWAWTAVAGLLDDKGKAEDRPILHESPAGAPGASARPLANPPAGTCRLTGAVRVEETCEPIAGAIVRIHLDERNGFQAPRQTLVQTDADGRFVADLPAGVIRVEIAECPRGYYWLRKGPGSMDSFVVGADREIHREYLLRKGTTWDFQFTRGPERKPAAGYVAGSAVNLQDQFQATADENGRLHITLPSEARLDYLELREFARDSFRLDTGSVFLSLEWEAGFQPAAVNEISQAADRGFGINLFDANSKSAILRTAPAIVEPLIENGRLVIRVSLPDRESSDFGAVTGLVLDEKDRPLPGVLVGLATSGSRVSNELRHHSTTTALGRYRLRDIPRRGIDGKPLEFQVVVAKQGHAGVVSTPLSFKEGTAAKFEVLDPIRLRPGVVLSGTVIDHRGRPVSGVRVRANKPIPYSGLSETIQTAWTDENGRFTIRDLRRGMALLNASNGVLEAWEHVMIGSSAPVSLRLPEKRQ